jgi:hypothetical protein
MQLNYVFERERSACALFGVTVLHTANCCVNILYGLISLFSFLSYLDNTVAGSIPSGMPIFESLVENV